MAVTSEMEKVMETRKPIIIGNIAKEGDIYGKDEVESKIIYPIIVEGDGLGIVIIISKTERFTQDGMYMKLAETAAGFLSKQMGGQY